MWLPKSAQAHWNDAWASVSASLPKWPKRDSKRGIWGLGYAFPARPMTMTRSTIEAEMAAVSERQNSRVPPAPLLEELEEFLGMDNLHDHPLFPEPIPEYARFTDAIHPTTGVSYTFDGWNMHSRLTAASSTLRLERSTKDTRG